MVTIIDTTEIDGEWRIERSVRGGLDMFRGDFDFDIGKNLELVVDGFVIIFQSVEVGVTKKNSLEFVVNGFRRGKCSCEGQEIIIGLNVSFFEGFSKKF